jgi:VWFA-related protein
MGLRMGLLAVATCATVTALASWQFPVAAKQAAQTPSAGPAKAAAATPDPNKVVLDVVVTDKNGPPIGGLAQTDFTVLDNGAPQQMTSFRALTGREEPIATLIVIDAVNESVTNVSYARQELGKFLKSESGSLARPMQIAVLTEKGLQLLGPSSIKGADLSAQLDGADTVLRTVRTGSGIYGVQELNAISTGAFSALARGELGAPGRKMVIVFSPGWSLMMSADVMYEVKTQLKIWQSAAQINYDLRMARITLQMIDPLGTNDVRDSAFYYKRFVNGITKLSGAEFGDLGLQVITTQSGGMVLTESNDLGAELRRCLADLTNYYEVTYAVPAWTGKSKAGEPQWHKVEVKMAANAQTARTRTGYYVAPPAK